MRSPTTAMLQTAVGPAGRSSQVVTAPLLTHAVKIELPKASSQPTVTPPENIQLGVKANGEIYWNGEPVEQSEMLERMAAAAKRDPQPEVHLRAERTTE